MKIKYKNYILTIWLENNYGCINECNYCYSNRYFKKVNFDKINFFKNLVLLLNKYPIQNINILGEEIYDEKILSIIVGFIKLKYKDINLGITLSGKKIYKNLGIFDEIMISMDGLYGTFINREKRDLDILFQNIKNIYNDYIDKTIFSLTINKKSLPFFEQDFIFLLSYFKLKITDIHLRFAFGEDWNEDDITIIKEKKENLEKYLKVYNKFVNIGIDSYINFKNKDNLEDKEFTLKLNGKVYNCPIEAFYGITYKGANSCSHICLRNNFDPKNEYNINTKYVKTLNNFFNYE